MEIKDRIIDTTRNLFKRKGYSRTTIREIIKESGVTTGSLYNHFKDKDDILTAIRIQEFENVKQAALAISKANEMPLLILAMNMQIVFSLVREYEVYAETVLNSYMKPVISQVLMDHSTFMLKECFMIPENQINTETMYDKALLIKGMMHSIIDDYLKGYNSDLETKKRVLLEAIYKIFEVPQETINRVIEKSEEEMNKLDNLDFVFNRRQDDTI